MKKILAILGKALMVLSLLYPFAVCYLPIPWPLGRGCWGPDKFHAWKYGWTLPIVFILGLILCLISNYTRSIIPAETPKFSQSLPRYFFRVIAWCVVGIVAVDLVIYLFIGLIFGIKYFQIVAPIIIAIMVVCVMGFLGWKYYQSAKDRQN